MALTKVQSEMAGAGQVLQVVQGTFASGITTNSSTFSDTGLNVSITPKFATSKILVQVIIPGCSKYSTNNVLQIKLQRAGSDLLYIDTFAAYTGDTSNSAVGTCASIYLDNPATTSTINYKVQYRSQNSGGTVYICDSGNGYIPTASITLTEIAA